MRKMLFMTILTWEPEKEEEVTKRRAEWNYPEGMKLALIKGPMNRTATIWGFFSSLIVEKFTGKDLYEMLGYLQACHPEAVNSSQIIDNLKWGWGELEY